MEYLHSIDVLHTLSPRTVYFAKVDEVTPKGPEGEDTIDVKLAEVGLEPLRNAVRNIMRGRANLSCPSNPHDRYYWDPIRRVTLPNDKGLPGTM